MYLGYQNGKIVTYTDYMPDKKIFNLDKIESTEEEYIYIENDLYNGEFVLKTPEIEEELKKKEQERINMLSLTKREVFLALYKAKQITPEQIKAQITDPEALIEFEYANEYFRGNPLIDEIGQNLGYTSEDLDYLFMNGELPNKNNDGD